jgi:predicted GNAT family acetyltransferase
MVDLDRLLHARRQDQCEEHHRQRHLLGGIGKGKAEAGMTTMEIKDEREERARYAVYLDGERIGFASCVQVHDTILLPYVEVDPDRRDLGLGSMLVRRVLDDAREEGNTVIPLCPFARRWVDLHPDYALVARRPKPGELGAMNSLVEADRTMRLLHREESKTLVVSAEPEAL